MGFFRSPKLRWLLNWVPAALGVAMIAAESTATMSAENTSRWLLPVWIRFLGPISAAHWAEVHYLIRKSGHFLGYGLVSVGFFHGWRSSLRAEGGIRGLWRRAALLAILCTLLVASADEYHQTFLPGRQGSPVDVGIDLCGAIAAQLLVFALLSLLTRSSDQSNKDCYSLS
jgi:VanZ family protein